MELHTLENNNETNSVLPEGILAPEAHTEGVSKFFLLPQFDSIFFELRYFNKPSPELDKATARLAKELSDMPQGRVFKRNLRCLTYNLNRLRLKHSGMVLVCPDQGPYWSNLGRAINPYGISGMIAKIGKNLASLGYATFKSGYHFEGEGSAYSRIWPTAKLTALFDECSLGDQPLQFDKRDDFVFIGLKDEKGKKLPKYPAYGPKAKRMNGMLLTYNQFLQTASIHLPSQYNGGVDAWGLDYISRIFNNERLDRGGRFYNGFWMQIDSDARAHILINGNTTIELDYKAQHPHMLYALVADKHYDEFHTDKSPYLIHNQDGNPYDEAASKKLLLTALNAKDETSTARAIRNELRLDEKSHKKKGNWDELKKTQQLREFFKAETGNFEALLQDCFTKHEPIKEKLCSGVGLELQYLDSQITEYILRTLTAEGIVCLSVHDSFIVEEQHEERLREVMITAYTEIKLPKALPTITGERSGGAIQTPQTLH